MKYDSGDTAMAEAVTNSRHSLRQTDNPEGNVDYWNLEEEEGITAAMIKKNAAELRHQVDTVLTTPLSERGAREW
jgi:hypothetical protein